MALLIIALAFGGCSCAFDPLQGLRAPDKQKDLIVAVNELNEFAVKLNDRVDALEQLSKAKKKK